MNGVDEYLVHDEIVEDHSTDGLRAGEGCVSVLEDGSLHFIYGTFYGAGDHDKAILLETRSMDGGLTWIDPKQFIETPDDILNNMSVSSLRLQDGRTAVAFMRKVAQNNCHPIFMTSDDNAATWSDPLEVDDRGGYYVVNNDRLVQTSDGRILIPYAWHGFDSSKTFSGDIEPTYCGCFISDDSGATWRRSADEIYVRPEDVLVPENVDDSVDVSLFTEKLVIVSQEPGVVELSDGSVMMWCRTSGGYAYRAYSNDAGDTFSPFRPITEFAMPCGPQSIKTLPDSNRLIMLFNDRGNVPFGHPEFHWRRPLSFAVSDDDGHSWHSLGLLEPEPAPSNCYFSICFHQDNAIFSYYEGMMYNDANGMERPRNLVSLKLRIVKQDFFRNRNLR